MDSYFGFGGSDINPFVSPLPVRRRPKPQEQPLTPEEEKNILGYATGALSWLGETLDKAGSGMRGLLAGQPEQLLNWIPFSDTLGITDESGYFADTLNVLKKDDRVSGRELMEMAGAPKNKPGFFNSPEDAFWDVMGFGTEVVTDPLNLVAGGAAALTKAGKAAQAAEKISTLDDAAKLAAKAATGTAQNRLLGTTAAARADEIRQGLRGVFSLKIPFAKNPFYTFGAGSERAAKAVEALYYGKLSPVVPLRALFSKVVGGIGPGATKGGWGAAQKARDFAHHEFLNAAAIARDVGAVTAERYPALMKHWEKLAEHAKDIGDGEGFADLDQFIRTVGETGKTFGEAVPTTKARIQQLMAGGSTKDVEAFAEEASKFIDITLDMNESLKNLASKHGVPIKELNDLFIKHVPRRELAYASDYATNRQDFFRGVPGGTRTLQRISKDTRIAGTGKLSAEAREKLRQELEAELTGRGVDVYNGGWTKVFRRGLPESSANVADHPFGMAVTKKPLGEIPSVRPGEEYGTREVMAYVKPKKLLRVTRTTLVDDAGQETTGAGVSALKYLLGEEKFGKLTSMPLAELRKFVVKAGGKKAQGFTRNELLNYFGVGLAKRKGYDAISLTRRAPMRPTLGTKASGRIAKKLGVDSKDELFYMRFMDDDELTVLKNSALKWKDPKVSKPALEDLQRMWVDDKYFKPQIEALREVLPEDEMRVSLEKIYEGLKAGSQYGKHTIREDQRPLLDELTEYMRGLPQDATQTGIFNRGYLTDWLDYQEWIATAISNARSVHKLYDQVATTAPKDTWVSVLDSWGPALGKVPGKKRFAKLTEEGRDTFVRNFIARNQDEALTAGLDPEAPDFLKQVASRIYVDPRVAELQSRYVDAMHPKVQNWFSENVDKLTGYWKWGVTAPHISFHIRNLVDGMWRNFARVGSDTYQFNHLAKATKDYLGYAHTKDLSKLPYGKEALEQGIIDSNHLRDMIGHLSESKTAPTSFADALIGGAKRGWDVEGGKLKKTGNALKTAAEEMYRRVEFQNRYVPYAAAREAGMSPSQARHLAMEIQYDYGKLAGPAVEASFSDNVARKVFPFWSFLRNNIPYQLKQLVEHPGGGHAQTIRAINTAHKESGEFVPSWLRERAAIRLGGPEDKANLIQQFGLSLEDLSKFGMTHGTPDVGRTVDRVIGDMNPLIGAGVKLWTGRDPYSGRNIKDMELVTGSPFWDTVLYSSPAARFAGTTRMALDPRKPVSAKLVNALTGVKIGTHDLERAKLIELQNLNQELLKRDPLIREFTSAYLPAEKKAQAGPETVKALEMSRRLAKAYKALKKKRESKSTP